MAREPATLSDIKEQTYTQAIKVGAIGLIVLCVGLILLSFVSYYLSDENLTIARVGIVVVILVGLALIGWAGYQSARVRRVPTVLFQCPYCESHLSLLEQPHSDFECEVCHRTIRFDHGSVAAVRTITCSSCGASHKVSVLTERFVCDKCNHVLQLQAESEASRAVAARMSAAASAPQGIVLGGANEHVLIAAYDVVRERQVATILQRELGVDLQEARRLLGTITDRTPLMIAYDIPASAADSLRRQLEELGCKVLLRTAGGAHE